MNRTSGLPRAVLLAVVALIALLTAACSGSPAATGGSASHPAAGGSASPSAASGGGSPPAGTPVLQRKVLAYTDCMRSHGVAMPMLPALSPKPSGKPTAQPVKANGPGPGSPQFEAAQHDCQSLMPPSTKGGPGPAGTAGG
jgi:hypothetical protein